jgi:outer membrane receptor protein involved in Fe transport
VLLFNMARVLLSVLMVLAWLFVASEGGAQAVLAPKVKSLPDIELPKDAEVPGGGRIRVRVRIGVNGKGTVAKCEASRLLCDLVTDAIGRADFEPARREGNAVPSEVSVELRVRSLADEEVDVASVLEPSVPKVEKELLYSATAEVEARAEAPLKLELDGIRNIPGTFGEPFRILELLPGTVPLVNGQPYVYIRGAPPSASVYLYDDIPVPLIFHSILGPSTVQPGLIGAIDVYSGAAPARYGGALGGVVSATRRPFADDRVHGETELRIIDASALVNVPMPKQGSMTFGGRIGYPNLILNAVDVDASANYWDYQYRTGVDMSARSRFELIAIGARDDSVIDSEDPSETLALDLQYHRVDARFIGRVNRWSFIGSLLYGYDFSDVADASAQAIANASANIHRIGPRFWAIYGVRKAQLRLGGEMSALLGPANCVRGFQNISTPCDPEFAAEDRRLTGSAFADANVSATDWLDLSLGLRFDAWRTGQNLDMGVSPRARATFHAQEIADVFVGWGIGVRPATYSIPLPGLGDVPLEPGLQGANQTEGGVRFFLPYEITLETRGYLNIYRDLRFLDIFTEPEILDFSGLPVGLLGDSADGKSYGFEFLMQRPFDVGVSTLVSYTLGFSDLDANAILPGSPEGEQTFDYTPSYDVRHVLNAALGWQAKFGLILSARVFTRSGRAEGWVWLDPSGQVQQYVQRTPWFTRLDLMVAYEWSKPGRRMRVSFEWVNATLARDVQQIDSENSTDPACRIRWGTPAEECPLQFTTAIWYPNLSFRAIF